MGIIKGLLGFGQKIKGKEMLSFQRSQADIAADKADKMRKKFLAIHQRGRQSLLTGGMGDPTEANIVRTTLGGY